MLTPHVPIRQAALAAFCRRYHIRKLALFGSVLRDDCRPESDVDVLVEFEPGHIPGFEIGAMELELSDLIGHKVDLRTPEDFSVESRAHIAETSLVQYVAG